MEFKSKTKKNNNKNFIPSKNWNFFYNKETMSSIWFSLKNNNNKDFFFFLNQEI